MPATLSRSMASSSKAAGTGRGGAACPAGADPFAPPGPGAELYSRLDGQITAYTAELCSPAPEPSPRPTGSDNEAFKEVGGLILRTSFTLLYQYYSFFAYGPS